MKHYRVKTNKKTYTLGDPYDSLDMLGYYLLMRSMNDSDLGRFSFRSDNDKFQFIELSRESYCTDLGIEPMSLGVFVKVLSEDIVGSYMLTHRPSNRDLSKSEMDIVKHSLEMVLEDVLESVEI